MLENLKYIQGSNRGIAPVTNQEDIIDLTLDLFKVTCTLYCFPIEKAARQEFPLIIALPARY